MQKEEPASDGTSFAQSRSKRALSLPITHASKSMTSPRSPGGRLLFPSAFDSGAFDSRRQDIGVLTHLLSLSWRQAGRQLSRSLLIHARGDCSSKPQQCVAVDGSESCALRDILRLSTISSPLSCQAYTSTLLEYAREQLLEDEAFVSDGSTSSSIRSSRGASLEEMMLDTDNVLLPWSPQATSYRLHTDSGATEL